MDEYFEVTLEAEGNPYGLCDQLEELGFSGFVIEDESDFKAFLEENTQYWDFVDEDLEQEFRGTSRVKLWLTKDAAGEADLAQLQAAGLKPQSKNVKAEDWENNWRQHYKPLEIGEKLAIVPAWEENIPGRIPVVLDPGLLFGTGSHATTRMCLNSLESLAGPGRTALDIGCGSGILGIACAVLGCDRVVAADVDEKAREIVPENAALNRCDEKFTVYAGDILGSASLRARLGSGYDLVLANIVADVIIPLAPYVRGFMAPGGTFITSGIIDGREEETATALTAAGLRIEEHRHEEEWHCFVCR